LGSERVFIDRARHQTIAPLGIRPNACFFLRVVVQWWYVEKKRSNKAPRTVWRLSLVGSILLGAYAIEREVPILLAGFVINGLIYSRNLWMKKKSVKPLGRERIAVMGLLAVVTIAASGLLGQKLLASESLAWTLCGIVGQTIWSCRFVVQWWYTELRRVSHFPPAFWIVSLTGNFLLLAYALHLWNAVFIAGLALGPIVQIRNLILSRSTDFKSYHRVKQTLAQG
jgi:lipid-A-disaccharide synthase-like uncharacterized protein